MNFREILSMALGSLGGHRLRSILTMAGVTVGVFSVIGVMTAVSALRGSIETGLSILGSDVFQFSKNPTSIQAVGNNQEKFRKRKPITLAEGRRYAGLMLESTDVVCLTAGTTGQAVADGRTTDAGLDYKGTDEHFLEANHGSIDQGRNFTREDDQFARPVALIGQTVARLLFPSVSPVGRSIRVNAGVYTVIGTVASRGKAFGQDQDAFVLVPISRFLADNGADNYSLTIATAAPTPESYYATLDRGIVAMRIARGLAPEQENDFEATSNESLLATFAKVADAASAGALVISAIALLAAGVGIMNIMLVSVTERTREIGVRKSVGARRGQILAQFLLEAMALALAGGLAGIILGILAGDALALVLKASVVFPWAWAATGLLVCGAIGIGFGLYPAMRAAALDPIEALRYE